MIVVVFSGLRCTDENADVIVDGRECEQGSGAFTPRTFRMDFFLGKEPHLFWLLLIPDTG